MVWTIVEQHGQWAFLWLGAFHILPTVCGNSEYKEGLRIYVSVFSFGMLEPWYNFTQLSRALLWPSSKASLFRSALYWPVITCIELYQPKFYKVYCNPAELHLYAEISPDNRGHWGFNSYSSLTHLFARHHGQNLPRETEQKRDQIIYWLLYTLFSNMDITAS